MTVMHSQEQLDRVVSCHSSTSLGKRKKHSDAGAPESSGKTSAAGMDFSSLLECEMLSLAQKNR